MTNKDSVLDTEAAQAFCCTHLVLLVVSSELCLDQSVMESPSMETEPLPGMCENKMWTAMFTHVRGLEAFFHYQVYFRFTVS